MDPKEYIESGKLESYVLGVSSPEEIQEVECMARVFPEVRIELESLRNSVEGYVSSTAVTPPAHLKSKIFAAIEQEEKATIKPEAKVVQLNVPPKNQSQKFQLVACIILFLISSIAALMFYRKNDQLITEINDLKNDQQFTANALNKINDRLNNVNNQLLAVTSPDVLHITMKGTAVSPQSVSTIFWNKQSKDVFIAVNSLPEPASDKQYQLWGIVDGKPVDLGVFESRAGDSILQKMKSVDNVTTFAVTLEKTGGNPTPTIDQMYVAGNL